MLMFVPLKSSCALYTLLTFVVYSQNYNFSSVAEAGTLQLEFKYLAHLTGEREYWDKVERIMDVMESADKQDGLVPLFIK